MDIFSKRGGGGGLSSDANTNTDPISLREHADSRRSSLPPTTTARSDAPRSGDTSIGRALVDTSPEALRGAAISRRRADAWREETLTRTLPGRAEKRHSTRAPAPAPAEIAAGADRHELVFDAPEGLVALLGNCTLVVHLQPPSPTFCAAMARAYAKALTRADKISVLAVVERDAGRLPPGDGRDAVAALLQRFDKQLAAAALIHEEDGFKATAVRSIVTSISLVSRISFPLRMFSNAVNASAWVSVASPAGDGPGHSQLLRSIRELRSLRSPSDASTP